MSHPIVIEAPARLIDAALINSETLTYRIDPATARAVFDGDVLLEPSCYQIDAERSELRLMRVPAFAIRLLVGAARD